MDNDCFPEWLEKVKLVMEATGGELNLSVDGETVSDMQTASKNMIANMVKEIQKGVNTWDTYRAYCLKFYFLKRLQQKGNDQLKRLLGFGGIQTAWTDPLTNTAYPKWVNNEASEIFNNPVTYFEPIPTRRATLKKGLDPVHQSHTTYVCWLLFNGTRNGYPQWLFLQRYSYYFKDLDAMGWNAILEAYTEIKRAPDQLTMDKANGDSEERTLSKMNVEELPSPKADYCIANRNIFVRTLTGKLFEGWERILPPEIKQALEYIPPPVVPEPVPGPVPTAREALITPAIQKRVDDAIENIRVRQEFIALAISSAGGTGGAGGAGGAGGTEEVIMGGD